jgi:hypothetical protein
VLVRRDTRFFEKNIQLRRAQTAVTLFRHALAICREHNDRSRDIFTSFGASARKRANLMFSEV